MIKVLFLSGSEISIPLFDTLLHDNRFEIVGFVMQPDKIMNRGQKIQESFLKKTVSKSHIRIFQPEKLFNDQMLYNQFLKNRPDLLLTFAYGQLLDEKWLGLPVLYPINIHASILPKYRGASPINASVLNGDNEMGISVMKMVKKMDAGPVLEIIKFPVFANMNLSELVQLISEKSAELVPDILAKIDENSIFVEQDSENISYTTKINKQDAFIDFSESADVVYRKFLAYYGWPQIWSKFKGKSLKLLDIEKSDATSEPGLVSCTDGQISIGCSKGSILLNLLHPESKKPMLATDFVRGQPDFCGSQLPS